MSTALGIFFGVMGVLAGCVCIWHTKGLSLPTVGTLHQQDKYGRSRKKARRNWFIVFLISLAIVSLVIGGVI